MLYYTYIHILLINQKSEKDNGISSRIEKNAPKKISITVPVLMFSWSSYEWSLGLQNPLGVRDLPSPRDIIHQGRPSRFQKVFIKALRKVLAIPWKGLEEPRKIQDVRSRSTISGRLFDSTRPYGRFINAKRDKIKRKNQQILDSEWCPSWPCSRMPLPVYPGPSKLYPPVLQNLHSPCPTRPGADASHLMEVQ